jgi:hypothetical protein
MPFRNTWILLPLLARPVVMTRTVANFQWCDSPPEKRFNAVLTNAYVTLTEDDSGEIFVGFDAKVDSGTVDTAYFNVVVWDEVTGNRDKLKKQPLRGAAMSEPDSDGRVGIKARVQRHLADPKAATKYEATVSIWSGNGDEIMCWVTLFDVGLGGPIELPGIKMKTKSEL